MKSIDDLQNLVWLIENDGQISIGRLGPHRCAAVASDEDQMVAALVRYEDESLLDLMTRLDSAILGAEPAK